MIHLRLILCALALAGCQATNPRGQTAPPIFYPSVVNLGADVEIILCSPHEMREMFQVSFGLRPSLSWPIFVITENGPRGLSKIYLLRTDPAKMVQTLLKTLADHDMVDCRRFAGAIP